VCFWHVRKLKVCCCTSTQLLWKNLLNYFGWVEVRNLEGRWNIYEAHIFTRSLAQKCCLETTSLCLSTRLSLKNFWYSQYFYWNFGNLWLLCALPLISSIIFHSWRPNSQHNVNYVLDFHVPSDVQLSHFEELKSTFFTSLHFAVRVMY